MTMKERNVCVFFLFVIYVSAVRCTFYNVGVQYEVALNVYSGRDDPTWKLDQKHALFSDVTRSLNSGPPTDMFGGLGYKGFSVEATNALGQKAWKTVGRHTNRDLELMLMNSCPSGKLSPNIIKHINAGIYGMVETHTTTISSEDDTITVKHTINTVYGRKKRQARLYTCGTRFTPLNWNFPLAIQRRNNCYNYATNRQTNTFAQPGKFSGRRYTRTTPIDVGRAIVRDGLQPVPTGSGHLELGLCKVYLVIWPGEDYHFLRLDNDGTWSHKSGKTRARNTDDSGRRITDIRTADLGPYTTSGGFFYVPDHVEVA